MIYQASYQFFLSLPTLAVSYKMERRLSTNSESSLEPADVSSSNKTFDANSSLAIKTSHDSDNVESDENEDYLNNNTCKRNDNSENTVNNVRRSATSQESKDAVVRRDNLRQLMDKMLQKKIMSTTRNNNHSSEENLNASPENGNGPKASSDDTKYVCPICEEISTTQHEFTNHIRNHNNVRDSSDDGSSFTCRICSKVLSSASSLDRHVLVHTGERPFNW